MGGEGGLEFEPPRASFLSGEGGMPHGRDISFDEGVFEKKS